MSGRLVFKTSTAEFRSKVLKVVADRLGKMLRRASPLIEKDLGVIVVELIQGSDVYQSLMNGGLRGHMGIEHPEQVLPAVVNAVARNIVVEIDPILVVGNRLRGGVSFGILKGDYADVLGVDGTSYVSPPSGRKIDWLDWMLTAGDQKLIMNHRITFDLSTEEKSRSRSGVALMFPEEGDSWSVPEYAAGVPGDNWLTRAFEAPGVGRRVAAVIQKRFREVLR